MRYLAPILALCLLSLGALSEPAAAQPSRARQGVQNGEVRSLDQILNGIRRERPGSLADVQGPDAGPSGEPHYRLKWVTPDGRVQWLDTDARTGRVLGVQGDNRPGPQQGPPGNFRPRPEGFAPRGEFQGSPGGQGPRDPRFRGGPPGVPPEAQRPQDPRFRGGPQGVPPEAQRPQDPRFRGGPPGVPPGAQGPQDPRFRGGAPADPRGRFVPRGGFPGAFERGPGEFERGPGGPSRFVPSNRGPMPGPGRDPRGGGFSGRFGR
jgi:hypothetical protein